MMGGSRGDIKQKARREKLFVPSSILRQNLDLCGMPYVPALLSKTDRWAQGEK
jgi:hypothetical protein